MGSEMNDMEHKIIEAAIACIEEYGINDTTVRKIAAKAGVNIAAINYYFGSKDDLFARVMEITLQNAFDWEHFESSDNSTPKERLTRILEHLTAGAQNYPQITRTHFYGWIGSNKTDPEILKHLQVFLERLYQDLTIRGAALKEKELRFAILQAFSASIFGIGLLREMCSQFVQQDLSDPTVLKQYISSLVESVLG